MPVPSRAERAPPATAPVEPMGWLERRLMRWISRREGGDTDMTQDYEYTNWDSVRSFADDIAGLIAAHAVLH